MKIYGKQVFIGSKKLCTEYTSKIIGGFSDCYIGNFEFKGKDIEKDIIFIKDKNGYLIDIKDIEGTGFLALNCYGAVTRYKTEPHRAGDYYIGDLKPYMSELDQEIIFDLKTLLQALKEEISTSNQL